MPSQSELWLDVVARRLGELRYQLVFIGGAVLALLIDEPGATPVRPTDDLDAIVAVASRVRYYELEDRLRELGFRPDTSPGAPLCRWLIDGITLDVMPTDPAILGFSNRWSDQAIEHAVERAIHSGLSIRVVTAPFFLALKLEAFEGRGNGDFLGSHDLEDIITIVDGRTTLTQEIEQAPLELRNYLAEKLRGLLDTQSFLDALPGQLPADEASQARLPIVLERLHHIAVDPAYRDRTLAALSDLVASGKAIVGVHGPRVSNGNAQTYVKFLGTTYECDHLDGEGNIRAPEDVATILEALARRHT